MRSKYIQKMVLKMIGLLTMLPLQAETVRDAFLSMLEFMLFSLNFSNRINLIDLYDAHLQSVVLNMFGDTVTLKNLTTDYLLLKMKNSSLQLIVLPIINSSKFYCSIYTICGSVCDSYIEFYSVLGTITDKFIYSILILLMNTQIILLGMLLLYNLFIILKLYRYSNFILFQNM